MQSLFLHSNHSDVLKAYQNYYSKTKRNKLGLGDFNARIYNKVDDKIDVALGFTHSFAGLSDIINMGLRYRHSDSFTLKTKVIFVNLF